MESTLLARRRRLSAWSSYGDQTTEPWPSRPRRVSSETQDAPEFLLRIDRAEPSRTSRCSPAASGLLSLTSPLAAPGARVDVEHHLIEIPAHRVGADLDGLGEQAQRLQLVDGGPA